MVKLGVLSTACAAMLLAGPGSAAAGGLPAIFPVAQSVTALTGTVAVTPTVSLVAGPTADTQTLDLVRSVLSAAGARRFTRLQPRGALVVSVGAQARDLPPEGYLLQIA